MKNYILIETGAEDATFIGKIEDELHYFEIYQLGNATPISEVIPAADRRKWYYNFSGNIKSTRSIFIFERKKY